MANSLVLLGNFHTESFVLAEWENVSNCENALNMLSHGKPLIGKIIDRRENVVAYIHGGWHYGLQSQPYVYFSAASPCCRRLLTGLGDRTQCNGCGQTLPYAEAHHWWQNGAQFAYAGDKILAYWLNRNVLENALQTELMVQEFPLWNTGWLNLLTLVENKD